MKKLYMHNTFKYEPVLCYIPKITPKTLKIPQFNCVSDAMYISRGSLASLLMENTYSTIKYIIK